MVASNYTQNKNGTAPYLMELQGWLERTRSKFGDYLSSDTMRLDFAKEGWSEDRAHGYCEGLRSYIIQAKKQPKEEAPGSKLLHLRLCPERNGSVVYDMANGGIYAMMNRNPETGSVSFYGPERALTMIGGRQELGGIAMDLRDGIVDGGYFQKDGKLVR